MKEEQQNSSIENQTKEKEVKNDTKIAAVGEVVSIPDTALNQAIRRKLGI